MLVVLKTCSTLSSRLACGHFGSRSNVTTIQLQTIEGKQTYGGYSTSVVVDEKFVLRIPENIDKKRPHFHICRNHNLLPVTGKVKAGIK
jgi:D-arabinose 1-dehydrogenase-like Zn-dependent alcohol dehydrogenase